jgi:hypothetical protein
MKSLLITAWLIVGLGLLVGCSGSNATSSSPDQSRSADNRAAGQINPSRPIGQPNTPRIPKAPPR